MSNNLYFSYQGAFGPPTFGHYVAMDSFTKKIIDKYGKSYTINMMFMPTAESISKPHLKFSKDSRVKILLEFCKRLKEKYPRINFITSNIEYSIYEERNSSHSIYTVEKLREISKPGDLIFFGMGLDNLYQIPYWYRINEFSNNLEGIYYVNRNINDEDFIITDEFMVFDQELKIDNKEKYIRFQKILPWNMKPNNIFTRFMKFESKINYSKIDSEKNMFIKGFDITTLFPKNNVINTSLPKFYSISETFIPRTSSSMLRFFIYKLIKTKENKYKNYIKNLIFGKEYNNIQLIDELIIEYEKIFNIIPIPEDKNFQEEYDKLFICK